MRAWIHTRSGPPSQVLSLTSSLSTPGEGSTDPSKPELLTVRVHYASLNPGGSVMMNLCPFLFRNRSRPAIPELDFAGEIIDAPEVTRTKFQASDRVFGSIPVPDHISKGSGALAEFVRISPDYVSLKPSGMSLKEAAGLGVAGCTALVLLDKAELKEGERVLINGASGGIGTFVVQLAKAAVGETGTVVAICSGTNKETVRDLGADEVVDYRKHAPLHTFLAETYPPENPEQGFDRIIDCYGVQSFYAHSDSYLKPGKQFITVGIAFADYTYGAMVSAVCSMVRNAIWPPAKKEYVQVTGLVNTEGLRRLKSLIEEGRIKRVQIDSCWDMDDALQAYVRMLSRRAKGKIIVRVAQYADNES